MLLQGSWGCGQGEAEAGFQDSLSWEVMDSNRDQSTGRCDFPGPAQLSGSREGWTGSRVSPGRREDGQRQGTESTGVTSGGIPAGQTGK